MGNRRFGAGYVLLAATVLAVGMFTAGISRASEPSAGELFREIEGRYDRVSTLSYKVKRIVASKTSSTEEQWSFRYRSPDLLRIDYTVPHDRVIVVNNEALWEYVPRAKKAAKTVFAAMPRGKKEKTIAQVMAHVTVDGLRIGNYAEMEKKAVKVKTVSSSGISAYQVEGVDPRYVITIDREKKVLLRSEIYDKKGALVLRTEASRFVEAGPGFWMPREIKATYATATGFVQSTVLLSDQRADGPVEEKAFSFVVPQGVELINY
ncbi:MAG: outer membrane lipoprotein carrier protein LolA [Nitrospirota bacterium]|nr:outer membrane lipoprotein carrier protein LolA [Nitrospirota bacterium]